MGVIDSKTGAKKKVYQCQYCSRLLSKSSNLIRHYKTCKVKNYQHPECSLCGMEFNNLKDRKLHEKMYCDVLHL